MDDWKLNAYPVIKMERYN